MRNLILALAGIALYPSSAAPAQDAQQRVEWNQSMEPFRIAGNVYYVGTSGLGAYLIADPQGHVLVDGGLPESAALIARNIEKLGFKLDDVEYLLVNHSHFDHSGGLAELKRRTGARLVASKGDAADLEAGRTLGRPELEPFPAVEVDRIVEDGDRLRVGGTSLRALLTPGHTKGCTTWLLESGDKRVLFACSLTVAGQKLAGDPSYPHAADDFRLTFRKLRNVKADVFVNFHPDFFDLQGKRARQLAGERNAFVDPAELARQVNRAEKGFLEELRKN